MVVWRGNYRVGTRGVLPGHDVHDGRGMGGKSRNQKNTDDQSNKNNDNE